MKILIVEDSKLQRRIIKKNIKKIRDDLEVVEAENGKVALELSESEHPDIIFSDWNMPIMTGIDLLKAIRKSGKETAFIFISSNATDDMIQLANEMGATHFIPKPFKPKDIKDALSLILDGGKIDQPAVGSGRSESSDSVEGKGFDLSQNEMSELLFSTLESVLETSVGYSGVKRGEIFTEAPSDVNGVFLKLEGSLNYGLYLFADAISFQDLTDDFLTYQEKDLDEEESLDDDSFELPETDTTDAMGEIVNMAAGVLLRKVADRGVKLAITVPILLEGRFLGVEPKEFVSVFIEHEDKKLCFGICIL